MPPRSTVVHFRGVNLLHDFLSRFRNARDEQSVPADDVSGSLDAEHRSVKGSGSFPDYISLSLCLAACSSCQSREV